MSRAELQGYRLSPQQARSWVIQQHCAPYCVQCALELEGDLDLRALKNGLSRVIHRHEILRTSFTTAPGLTLPVQVISLVVDCSWWTGEFDPPGQQAGEIPEEIERLLQEERRAFANDQDSPLVRAALATIAVDKHLLVLTISAMCADTWTLGQMVSELLELHDCMVLGGGEPGSPSEPVQYADFAEWQNQLISESGGHTGSEYWRRNGARGHRPNLPFERKSALPAFRHDSVNWTFDRLLTSQVQSAATDHSTTSAVFLFTCWQILIWRMTGETEVAAGWTCHGRDSRETEVSLGPFAKVLPIRCHPQGLRFAEVLHLMNGSVQEATGWQEYFDVQPAFGADGPPECSQLGFEFYEWPKQPCPGPLRASLLRCDTAVEPHKLKLTFVGFNSTIRVQLAYDSGLFSRIDAESIKRRFDVLLRSAMAGDTVRADDLRLLDETERTQLLRDFSNQDESRWADRSIHEMFELREAALPDAAALCSSESQITYRLLNQRANQCARRLRRAGVSAETVVGIFVERSPDLVIAMLAVLKAGGAYVVLDPNYPRSRLAHLLEDTNTRVVVSRGHMLEALGPYQGSAICFDRDQRLLDIEAAGNLESLSPESSLAYIAYTSGSTGKPKGILANHTGVLNYLRYINQTYSIDASDKVLQLASFTFDASVRDSIGPLTAGATVILPSAEEARDPVALLALIRRSEVTRILSIVPTMLRNLTAAADERGPAYRTVQTILVSGEPLYMPDCERTRAVFHATAMLVNQYGPTESTMTSTYHRLVDGDGGNSQVPIGKPIPNSRLYILGPRLDLTPPGTKGLVHIGGAGVARGYLNRPGLTAQRFIPDPFSIEIGMRVYDVGDLAYYTSTGDLELAGRKDHQVKVRGVRIELGEIEAALGQHPSIRESAAVAREDRGETTLVAFYTSAGVPAPSQAELRAFLRERLPEQALPSALVELWTMPLTPNGKVDRAALAHSALCVRPPYVAPRTLVEQTMAAIWANVLEVEKPGVTDNFFDLGGHSLRAASLIYKVLNAFQIELPLRSIFDFPTLGEFCGYLVSEKGATQRFDEPPLEPVPARGRANRAPLSFSQQRLWFLDQLNPASAAYNLLIMLRLNGVVSEPALATGFEEILNRHEALRTRFTVIEDQPFQIIDEAPTGSIAVYDLRTLPVRERESVAKHLASAEAARPFDLSAGPLFKASLFRIADTEHVLLITMHHIVSDLWSIGILVRELAATYASLCCGKPGTLADLPIQYTDFAVWQRDWMRDEVLESQLTYWTTQLAGLGVLRLPSDRPRPPVQTHQGAREGITLTNNSVERLNALVRQESATLFIGLLAGFMVLLHRYSGDDDIAVGSPSANRNRGPVENLVGLFANTLVLRTNLGGNPSFRELVRRVRTTALDAYAHQDVPFEKIVESLQPHRDLSRNPLFQVLFALQNVPMGTVALPALEMEPIGIPGDTARFDLALWFVERPFGLAGSLEYSTDLFDRETIAFLIGHLQNIIASAAADPEHRIGSLALLAPAERSNLLFEWNHPHPDPPAKSINQLFEAVALRLPDSVAIACEEKSLTFGDLNRCADQLSAYLRKLCPTPSNRFVGICLDRSIELIVAILGVWKSGAAYVPLDPTYPSERLAQMIADSHTVVVLADEPGNAILPPLDTPIVRLDLDWPAIAQTNWPAAPALMDPDEPAYVIFTSGSTGRPKGVVVCHTSVVSLIQATDSLFDLPGQDVWTLFHSCSFDISVWEISRCLLGGSRLIVVPGWMTRSPASFYGLLRDERVTILNQTPSALRQLIDAKDEAEDRDEEPGNCLSLSLLICGGEALSGELSAKSLKWSIPALNLYGPTEATVWASIHPIDASDGTKALTPIGRPLLNTTIHLLDERQELVPPVVVGEIYIGGPGLAQGYLNHPDFTAERFIPDPFGTNPGRRLYRTGDLARRENASIEYLNRIDHQVKIRGYRVELGEVQSLLVRHPDIIDCVVTVGEGRTGEKQLLAYIVNAPGKSATIAEWRSYLKNLLPDFMVPTTFVTLGAIPLTPNGKIDRKSLPAPESLRPLPPGGLTQPRTFYEAVLAGIWAGVLGFEEIGIHDNFFDIGGHSLLVPAIVSRAQTLLRLRVPVRSLFESPTIATLARTIEEARRVKSPDNRWTPVVELQRGSSSVPFFCVHAGGGGVGCYLDLARYLGPDQPYYGIQAPEHGGLDGAQARFNSVEELAASYVRAVREAQPAGPYLLGGWSAGGVIAFEMARQLRAEGQAVALLALLDCMPRSIMASRLDPGAMAFLYAKAMAASSGGELRVSFDSLRELELGETVDFLVAELKRAGIVPPETKAGWFKTLLEGVQSRSESLTRYVPRTYPGKITLFRGTEIDAEFIKAQNAIDSVSIDYRDRTNGWSSFASEQVEVFDVPGHHYTIVLEPHVKSLAKQLKACIDRALKQTLDAA